MRWRALLPPTPEPTPYVLVIRSYGDALQSDRGDSGTSNSELEMTQPTDPFSSRNTRYRFRNGKPVDPNEGLHPEMTDDALAAPLSSGIPASPQKLIAMQTHEQRPEKSERTQSPKVKEVLDRIESLDTTAHEDRQIALVLVRHLEAFHDGVVEEMASDDAARHSQIVAWAVDADRLMRARMLLETVDLE